MVNNYIYNSSAKDKLNTLWARITKSDKSASWPGLKLAGIFVESMNPTFDAPGDELPSQGLWGTRSKYIHTVGATGVVKFNLDPSNPFSGMFKQADEGIIRFSAAVEPSNKQPLAPGLGLKFLRDGQDSANLVSMYSVDGQPGDWNFFSNEFKNWIKAPAGGATKLLAGKFATATDLIQTVGLSNWGMVDQHGNKVDNPVFPFEMRFVPHSDVANLFPHEMHGVGPMAFLDDLTNVPANANLYSVYGLDGPTERGGKEHFIGTLQLRGSLVKSNYGDEHLFFRHQKMDDDLKLQPDWAPYVPKYSLDGKCPYEKMLQQLGLI